MTARLLGDIWNLGILALLLAFGGSTPASAQGHGHGAPGAPGVRSAPPNQHLDPRFGHNQYYFNRGYGTHRPPPGGYAVDRRGDHYWYNGGHWYRRRGFGWAVDGPPIGAFVWFLPPLFTTVWFGGIPYYYANDTYYIWNSDHGQYEVVDPPSGIETGGTTHIPPSDTLFIYPKNGQSSEQQASDRYECHHSAVEQSGYDPTRAGGGVAPADATRRRADYFRADAACLDARGYSVR
jgi:hypothetical protein